MFCHRLVECFSLTIPLDHLLVTDLNTVNREQQCSISHSSAYIPRSAFPVSSAEKLPLRKRECNNAVVVFLKPIGWVGQNYGACINPWGLILVASLAKVKRWYVSFPASCSSCRSKTSKPGPPNLIISLCNISHTLSAISFFPRT